MTNTDIDYGYNAVVIRFSSATPYFPLSLAYGLFLDPTTHIFWTSVDAYLAYHMLTRLEDRQEVLRASNGRAAYNALLWVLKQASEAGEDVISPTWERDREAILYEALRLKYTQCSSVAGILKRTLDRPIFDASRSDDEYLCTYGGVGQNMHGKMLEKIRELLLNGEVLPARS